MCLDQRTQVVLGIVNPLDQVQSVLLVGYFTRLVDLRLILSYELCMGFMKVLFSVD